jgi:hypothetical protein
MKANEQYDEARRKALEVLSEHKSGGVALSDSLRHLQRVAVLDCMAMMWLHGSNYTLHRLRSELGLPEPPDVLQTQERV